MSTLGLNARVWVAWWPTTEIDEMYMRQIGDPRLQYGTIKDGPIDAPPHYLKVNFWRVATDNGIEGWIAESMLWPVGGEPVDTPETRNVTRPVEEHSEQ